MYFFHLGLGPFLGRYFGGDLPSDATEADQTTPWTNDMHTALPHDLSGREMHLRVHVFCLRSSCRPHKQRDPDVSPELHDVHESIKLALGAEEAPSGRLQCRYRHRWYA
jgi:hypothetical protein